MRTKLLSAKLANHKENDKYSLIASRCKELRAIASNDSELLELYLSDTDAQIRSMAVIDHKLICLLTANQIERGLTDVSSEVRKQFIGNAHLHLTPLQIERGLTDTDAEVRAEMAFRIDYTATALQIERGLTDKAYHVRRTFLLRHCQDSLTSEQFERALVDENESARAFVASNKIYPLTAMQIERGLTDGSEFVRLAFLGRNDISFTDAQIARGLKDKSKEVRKKFKELCRQNELTQT